MTSMKTATWLHSSTKILLQAGISTARLDALVLLEDVSGHNRGWLLAHPEFELSKQHIMALNSQVAQRERHKPLAYIRGKSEFFGREFAVNAHTLQPRPETEAIINILKKLATDERWDIGDEIFQVVDVGTGSGCLAITAKLELPNVQVYATDIDDRCIKTARQNARKHKVDIGFFIGDLLAATPSTIYHLPSTIILANLPYVPDGHTINQAAMFEPSHAIFGGLDGLDLYRRLFEQIINVSHKPRHVLTESLPFQHKQLIEIAELAGYKLQKSDDFIQCFVLEPIPK